MGLTKLKVFLEMIKFEHTIFALPFAYLGAFLAAGGFPTAHQFFWITMAMVGARTSAMALNRVIDREIDARNPRTQNRALPRGRLKTGEVWLSIILSFGLLYISAAKLQPICVKLMPLAVLVLVLYSYMKRFSWTCHLVLGLALGTAPVGSWLAITGEFALLPILLGLAVMFWVAGFDIIYACQDYEFDRREGLHSIPVRFGIPRALIISKVFHVISPVLLVIVGQMMNLGLFYDLGLVVAVVLLIKEHRLITPRDLSKIDIAFFNMNGYLSTSVFLFTLLDMVF